jgi:hypothetical protein
MTICRCPKAIELSQEKDTFYGASGQRLKNGNAGTKPKERWKRMIRKGWLDGIS